MLQMGKFWYKFSLELEKYKMRYFGEILCRAYDFFRALWRKEHCVLPTKHIGGYELYDQNSAQ